MKIGILTNFQDFGPQYSLTQIVLTQAKLLKRYSHDVHLFTCEQFNPKDEALIPEAAHDVTDGGTAEAGQLTQLGLGKLVVLNEQREQEFFVFQAHTA